MTNLERFLERSQKIIHSVPTLIIGSGASCALNVASMSDLRTHLMSVKLEDGLDSEIWQKFCRDLNGSSDLEAILSKAELDEKHSDFVVQEVWSRIYNDCSNVFARVTSDLATKLPLSRLLRLLFTSTARRLNVITTNYDCIIEYAANAAGYEFFTGFAKGFISTPTSASKCKCLHRPRVVEIAKVHGSLDWFRAQEKGGKVYCLPSFQNLDRAFKPVMITPGVNKYQVAYDEPYRSTIDRADIMLKNAPAFMSIGFGFNDTHIQTKLFDGVLDDKKKLLILSRTLTANAKMLIEDERNQDFVAFEYSAEGYTRAYDSNHRGGIVIEGELWDLGKLLDLVSLN